MANLPTSNLSCTYPAKQYFTADKENYYVKDSRSERMFSHLPPYYSRKAFWGQLRCRNQIFQTFKQALQQWKCFSWQQIGPHRLSWNGSRSTFATFARLAERSFTKRRRLLYPFELIFSVRLRVLIGYTAQSMSLLWVTSYISARILYLNWFLRALVCSVIDLENIIGSCRVEYISAQNDSLFCNV